MTNVRPEIGKLAKDFSFVGYAPDQANDANSVITSALLHGEGDNILFVMSAKGASVPESENVYRTLAAYGETGARFGSDGDDTTFVLGVSGKRKCADMLNSLVNAKTARPLMSDDLRNQIITAIENPSVAAIAPRGFAPAVNAPV
jgi:hypothetical protein